MQVHQITTRNIRQGKAFDIIYQQEDRNAAAEERNQTVISDDLAALIGTAARFGFLANFTEIGSELRARLNDDMADQLMATDEQGLQKNISSFGIAEIYLPEKELRRFAPFYLACRAAGKITGSSFSEEARAETFLRFLNGLGMDEQLFSLLESIAQQPLDEGGRRHLADHIRMRLHSLLERPLQERLNTMPMVVEELEKELPDILGANTEQVFEEKRRSLLSAASELANASGLIPLEEVVGAFEKFLNERQVQQRAKIEALTLARNQLLEQKIEVEGRIAQIQTLAFGPIKERSLWDRLIGANTGLEREIAQIKVDELAARLYQLEHDNLIFQLEIMRRGKATELLRQLNGELAALLDQTQKALARLGELKAQIQPEMSLLSNLDFKFHVPVGFCMIRGEPHRQDDMDYFTERLVVDGSTKQTVETVVTGLREQMGEFWTLAEAESLVERLLELAESRLKNELQIWEEMENRFGKKQIQDRIDYCVGASAGYLLTDSAVNHDNRSRIKIVGAPQAAHEPLRRSLEQAGQADWLFVATGDRSRISFLQVRVGIPLYSIKSHRTNMDAYSKQSNQHDEERLHTCPEWRFLPDVAPIESRDDPKIGVYVLQGVVAERLTHQQETGTYWYVPVSGPMELMGSSEAGVTEYLLAHQDSFVEIVSSFYALFHLNGGVEALKQAALEVAQKQCPFSAWINDGAVRAVMRQLEWVRKNYDVGGGA